jgi:hypothetical protein
MSAEFIENPTLDQIPFDTLKDVYKIWQNVNAEHGHAAREHLTPMLLKDHLPYLALIDRDVPTNRYKVRLIGTRYSEAIGFETTGVYLDELENTEALVSRFQWLVDNRKPYYAYLDEMQWAGKDYRHYGVVGCPLFDANKDVNMLLFRVTFERTDSTEDMNSLF